MSTLSSKPRIPKRVSLSQGQIPQSPITNFDLPLCVNPGTFLVKGNTLTTLRGTPILRNTWLISLTYVWHTSRVGSSQTYSNLRADTQVSKSCVEHSVVSSSIYEPASNCVDRSVVPVAWFVYEAVVCMETATTA